MNKLIWAILMFSLLAAKSAGADVLVLVHGYLGTAHSWAESGVIHRIADRIGHVGVGGQGGAVTGGVGGTSVCVIAPPQAIARSVRAKPTAHRRTTRGSTRASLAVSSIAVTSLIHSEPDGGEPCAGFRPVPGRLGYY